ncbi:hypothetical protein GW17_00061835 [Ensete ventricosum]|nr:hypothetical protein GW17_00061835 [Ensete ventricosum]
MLWLLMKNSTSEVDSEPGPLAQAPEMSPPVLSESLRTFFGLVTGTEGLLPEFEQLQLPRLCSDASIRVARALADGYELLYKAVVDPKNKYPDPRSLGLCGQTFALALATEELWQGKRERVVAKSSFISVHKTYRGETVMADFVHCNFTSLAGTRTTIESEAAHHCATVGRTHARTHART